MNSEFRSPLDDEIDDVARSMTAATPSAAFRSGVRARIAGRSGGSHGVRWSLGIAAAAAVIVLALVWPDREAPVDVPASRETVATVATPAGTNPSIGPGQTEPATVVGQATTEESLPDGPLASVGPLVVEPLEDLDPLGLNGIEIPTLTVEAMTVAPLSQQ